MVSEVMTVGMGRGRSSASASASCCCADGDAAVGEEASSVSAMLGMRDVGVGLDGVEAVWLWVWGAAASAVGMVVGGGRESILLWCVVIERIGFLFDPEMRCLGEYIVDTADLLMVYLLLQVVLYIGG